MGEDRPLILPREQDWPPPGCGSWHPYELGKRTIERRRRILIGTDQATIKEVQAGSKQPLGRGVDPEDLATVIEQRDCSPIHFERSERPLGPTDPDSARKPHHACDFVGKGGKPFFFPRSEWALVNRPLN